MLSQENNISKKTQIQGITQNFISTVLPISLLLLGIFLSSLAAIFTRISEQEIGANSTIFNRIWIATVFLWFYNRVYSFLNPVSIPATENCENSIFNHLGLLILSGIVDLTCILLWAWSLEKTSVTNSTLLHNLTPVFTVLVSWLFLRQSFNWQFIFGLMIAAIGSSAIAFNDFQFGSQYLVGDGLALSSAAFYGVAYIIYEKIRQNISAASLLFYNCCVRTIIIFPLALLTDTQIFPSSWSGWLTVIFLGILCQGLGHLFLIHSLKKFSAVFVSLFFLLDPILTAILAWFIFSERFDFTNWIAFVVVLVGIYYARQGSVHEAPTSS